MLTNEDVRNGEVQVCYELVSVCGCVKIGSGSSSKSVKKIWMR